MNSRSDYAQIVRYIFRPFSPSRRKKIACEMTGLQDAALPGSLLKWMLERHGPGGLLLCDMLLFGGCLGAAALCDLMRISLPALRETVGTACCVAAFGVCDDIPQRAFLKVAFIALSLLLRGSWIVTVLFLILFEHIPCFPAG